MAYEKFDVERALAGEPVILRDGSKAYVRHHETELEVNYLLLGFDKDGCSRSWSEAGENVLSYGNIVGMWPKEPLTMPDSFWDMLHPHYNVIAKDASGTWFAYSEKPEKLEIFWNTGVGDFIELSTVMCCSFFPDCDWEDSLILRPAK